MEGQRFCKDCRHEDHPKNVEGVEYMPYLWRCMRVEQYDPVTGMRIGPQCSDERANWEKCGAKGGYFEGKVKLHAVP